MFSRLHVRRLSWSLIDQAIVSGGTFVLNVLLARHLPAAEYGAFALLFGGMLTLQLFTGMLIFHPLSVRLPHAEEAERHRLLRATLALVLLLAAMLSLLLAAAVLLASQPGLLVPSITCFLLWQLQEGLRRGLLSTFRYRAACLGDALNYLGRVAIMLLLAHGEVLSVETALYAMAAMSALGAIVQLVQLRLPVLGATAMRATVADFWAIGGFWSLGNGLLLHGRVQLLFWLLAVTAGAAEVAALQAAQNIINLMNPLMIGLNNVVPQAASQASRNGLHAAWRTARGYALLVLPLLLCYCALLSAFPETVLGLVYGAGSPYAGLGLYVRILVACALFSYYADFVVAVLYGLNMARRALATATVPAVLSLVLAFPLIPTWAALGMCILTLVVNAARFAVAFSIMRRVLNGEPVAQLGMVLPGLQRRAQ